MESIGQMTAVAGTKVKRSLVLWLEGFREACCLHRVIIYCLRSRKLLVRTGQCFLLNGFIFLGSIILLRSLIIPTLERILPVHGQDIRFPEPCFRGLLRLYSFLQLGLLQLFYVLWFYPLYIFSFIISCIWYNDIAQFGLLATSKHDSSISAPSSQKDPSVTDGPSNTDKPVNFGGIMIGIAEQIYSVILLNFFFLEVSLTGFLPYIGKALNFLLLSWMYAYYCFEYKWNFSGLSLDKRLDFFQSNWAFFAGFGSPCILAIFFFSPLVSYGVMAILFPLFVLTAAGSDASTIIEYRKGKCGGAGLGRLPIFFVADYLSMKVLSLLSIGHPEANPDKTL